MAFLTDRKRAIGMGSAKAGTEHFWSMTKSSFGLVILVPLFILTFAPMLGAPHADVVAYFARPFPAVVAGLTLVVGWMHFKGGVQALIEDYTDGLVRKGLILGTICLSYAAAAASVYAIARIAL
ncbi:succinate dehydrogenase, hydrophobic membrane anchor protein [Shimia ponticola]|uniref:succinate dehydrogenase, hydrophobic membrane anchor protein n=1 Tax=Shimia ponticola TaxID=2582893 RepID=UPI0011BE424A|nr:succinate dehydrogenase, hydrophobic membrane anchor protein [Shimia ponticola]